MKPDATQKNGLDGTPAEKKSDVARESGPPAWFGPALLQARAMDHSEAGHRLAKCGTCGGLLYEKDGNWFHDAEIPNPFHASAPTEIFDPRAQPAEPASDGCFAAEWKPTVRERLARFIFPRRTVGEIPVEMMSPAVKWGGGDVMTTHVWGDVSFSDLLRLLFSRRLLIEVKTVTELQPGHSTSRAVISVLPPQFLKPGPSGNWSPEDERDLFDLVAGVGGEAPEHPCALCTHPDCFKGYLPGRFGEAGMGDACPECLAAGRLEVRSDDWKMTPRELALQRAATGDHVGGTFAVAGNTAVWAPAGGPVQSVSERLPKELFEKIYEALGSASMCWEPRPTGVFDSTAASRFGREVCEAVAEELDRARRTGEKIQESLRLARQIAHWLNWHDAKVFTDRQSLEARASDAIDAALEISGRPCRFGTCPPSGCLIGTAHGCCGPEGLAGEPDAANPDADFWDKVEGRQPATGTKCVVCGIDCADAPRGFVRGAPIGETPALWQCPEHAEKGGAE